MNISEKVGMLSATDNNVSYKALKELIEVSKESNILYTYFDKFVDPMNDTSNSYNRTRGLRLIALNSKWDLEGKVNLIIEDYLDHIEDDKPITARQCIKDTVIIAQHKPELIDIILKYLRKFDRVYEDSMQSLIYKDREKAIRMIKQLEWWFFSGATVKNKALRIKSQKRLGISF